MSTQRINLDVSTTAIPIAEYMAKKISISVVWQKDKKSCLISKKEVDLLCTATKYLKDSTFSTASKVGYLAWLVEALLVVKTSFVFTEESVSKYATLSSSICQYASLVNNFDPNTTALLYLPKLRVRYLRAFWFMHHYHNLSDGYSVNGIEMTITKTEVPLFVDRDPKEVYEEECPKEPPAKKTRKTRTTKSKVEDKPKTISEKSRIMLRTKIHRILDDIVVAEAYDLPFYVASVYKESIYSEFPDILSATDKESYYSLCTLLQTSLIFRQTDRLLLTLLCQQALNLAKFDSEIASSILKNMIIASHLSPETAVSLTGKFGKGYDAKKMFNTQDKERDDIRRNRDLAQKARVDFSKESYAELKTL